MRAGHARLLLVALDRAGVADRSVVGIELELLARLALAKQIPTAIELDLELGEPPVAGVVRAVPLAPPLTSPPRDKRQRETRAVALHTRGRDAGSHDLQESRSVSIGPALPPLLVELPAARSA